MSSCDFFSCCGFWSWCVPKLTCWHLQVSFSQDCASFPSHQGSCLQHRDGRKLPYNWASIEIRRGIGSLHLIMQGSTLKMILPKWGMCSVSSSRKTEERRILRCCRILKALQRYWIDVVGDSVDLFHLHPPTSEGHILYTRRLAGLSEIAQVIKNQYN